MPYQKIDYQDEIVIEIYNKVVRPIDNSIDWNGFFIWCELKYVEDIELTSELIIIIRNEYNNFEKNKENIKKEIVENNRTHNIMLSKKFSGV